MRKLRYFKVGAQMSNKEWYPDLWSWEEATFTTTCYNKKGKTTQGTGFSRKDVDRYIRDGFWVEIPEADAALII